MSLIISALNLYFYLTSSVLVTTITSRDLRIRTGISSPLALITQLALSTLAYNCLPYISPSYNSLIIPIIPAICSLIALISFNASSYDITPFCSPRNAASLITFYASLALSSQFSPYIKVSIILTASLILLFANVPQSRLSTLQLLLYGLLPLILPSSAHSSL